MRRYKKVALGPCQGDLAKVIEVLPGVVGKELPTIDEPDPPDGWGYPNTAELGGSACRSR